MVLKKTWKQCIICLLITTILMSILCCFTVGATDPTEPATTETPVTTETPPTEAPTTEAPTTEAPTTKPSTTEVPSTEAPTAYHSTTGSSVLPTLADTKVVSLAVGKTAKLNHSLSGYVAYSCGDSGIATVSSDGTVKGIKKGTTWVLAYNSSYVQKYQINVTAAAETTTAVTTTSNQTVSISNTNGNTSYSHNASDTDIKSSGHRTANSLSYIFFGIGALIICLIIVVIIIAVRSRKKTPDMPDENEFDDLSDMLGDDIPENRSFKDIAAPYLNYYDDEDFPVESEEPQDEFNGEYEDIFSFDPNKDYTNNSDDDDDDDDIDDVDSFFDDRGDGISEFDFSDDE